MKKNILIYGIGSFKNKGCEALVNSTINQMHKKANIVAAFFDYENDKDKYKDKISKTVEHYKKDESKFTNEEKELLQYYNSIEFDYNNYESFYQRDVVKCLDDIDIAIHIGGDNYCYGVNEWMYCINNEAKKRNKKTVLWGASLYDEITDLTLIEDLKKYDLLMLREKISYNAISKYIPEEKLMLIPDPAFSLKCKKVKLSNWYDNKKVLGLNLSPLTIKTEEDYNVIIDFIKYVFEKTDYSISLIPHVTVDEVSDMLILKKIYDEFEDKEKIFIEKEDYNCEEVKYVISKCEMFIAARTHASIAAYSTNVPTLVLGYSVKSRGIAEDIFGNYKKYVIPSDELNLDNIIEKFNYIDSNKKEIRKTLEKQMKTKVEEASLLYEKMIERLEYLDKVNICPKEKCVGCTACANICPVGAIEMIENKEGFKYPKINMEKCINCGACKKICCINNKLEIKEKDNVNCYAVKSKNKEVLKNSSSGGVFYHLAENILSNNGIVYGASLNNFKVEHIRIAKISDLIKIQGSKYSQSDLKNTFKNVKEDLENEKVVLFSGTPCQILGLKMFLKKEYENLYTVSVICHGVINDKLLKKQYKEIEKKFNSSIKNIVYKSKIKGWDNSNIVYEMEKINKNYNYNDDKLMYLYVNNFILRESCYNCPAKGLDNNLADIILGDYWGVYHVHRELFDSLGTSAVIIKNKKGNDLFEEVKDNFVIVDTKYDDIAKYNPAIEESVNKPIFRNKIFEDLEDNTIDVVSDLCKIKIEENNKKNLVNEEEIANLKNELDQIYNSKRYKMINKLANIVNIFRHKK